MLTRLYLCFLIVLIGAGTALAGPFGFKFGAPPNNYEGCNVSPEGDFMWFCSKAPKPALGFDFYVIWATPSDGICEIKAIQYFENKNLREDELHYEVDKFARIISNKYGKPAITPEDFETTFWLSTTKRRVVNNLRKQSEYAFSWKFNTNSENELFSIVLLALDLDQERSAIRVDYSGTRVRECHEYRDKVLAAPF